MNKLKFKVGDRVRIKSLDWYNENKDEDDNIILINCTNSSYNFIEKMRGFCGKVMTISSVYMYSYNMVEDDCEYFWTDEMIEGLVEEGTKPNIIEEAKTYWDSIKDAWICPDGYIFKDENGNVIPVTKIVLEKKKKEYPKTFLGCCDVLGIEDTISRGVKGYKAELFDTLQKLIICRDAYWKIAGEEMGLGKPWTPQDTNTFSIFYDRLTGEIEKQDGYCGANSTLEFPTIEMRDAFYENFKEEIEICKELL